MRRPRVHRILLVGVLLTVALVLIAVVAVNLRLFVYPASSTPAHADAVVVLAGGDGERLDHGLDLVSRGIAPTLVVSRGSAALCNSRQSFDIVCFVPEPDDTRGEAEAIGKLAAQEGWHHLVLVTSDYHATRAHLLLDRCFRGTVDVSSARSDKSPLPLLWAIGHEWGGLVDTAIHRSC